MRGLSQKYAEGQCLPPRSSASSRHSLIVHFSHHWARFVVPTGFWICEGFDAGWRGGDDFSEPCCEWEHEVQPPAVRRNRAWPVWHEEKAAGAPCVGQTDKESKSSKIRGSFRSTPQQSDQRQSPDQPEDGRVDDPREKRVSTVGLKEKKRGRRAKIGKTRR
jgi:hypothetical protein